MSVSCYVDSGVRLVKSLTMVAEKPRKWHSGTVVFVVALVRVGLEGKSCAVARKTAAHLQFLISLR
jgi:hypothetical protein